MRGTGARSGVAVAAVVVLTLLASCSADDPDDSTALAVSEVDGTTTPNEPVDEQPQAACVEPVGTVEHTGEIEGDDPSSRDA